MGPSPSGEAGTTTTDRARLSRRALFGAGLLEAARRRVDEASPPPTPDPGAFWAAGDLARLSRRWTATVHDVLDTLALRPGERLLDVGAGDGALALAAARRGVAVTAVDVSPALVDRGRARAADAGLAIDWHVGDAARLPVEDGAFDAAASAFGVIYARDTSGAAAELLRVLRPGGRLGLATWSGGGAMGSLLALARRAGVGAPGRRPERWGSYEGLTLALTRFERFEVEERTLQWAYAGRDELWHDFTTPPGPLTGAGDALREPAEAVLEPYLRPCPAGVELAVGYCVVTASMP